MPQQLRREIGPARHQVAVDTPTTPVPDPDGGWTITYEPLNPAIWWCAIQAPTAKLKSLEGIAGGSVAAQATHLLSGRYHRGITTQTRFTFDGRTFNALYVDDIEQRHIKTEVLAAEVVK